MPAELSNRASVTPSRDKLLQLLGLMLTLTITACATPGTVKQIDKLDTVDASANILVMTPDVKYYLLTPVNRPLSSETRRCVDWLKSHTPIDLPQST